MSCVLLKLILVLLLVSEGRARLAFRLESNASLARLVVGSLAAELLRVTAIAGLANHILGHGHGHRFGESRGGEDMEKV